MQGKQPTEVSLYSGNKREKYSPKDHGEDISRFVHIGSVVRAKNVDAGTSGVNAGDNGKTQSKKINSK
jgi:hypothetical protein